MKTSLRSWLTLIILLPLVGCSTIPYRHASMDQVYAVFGDCYAAGAQADPPATKSFAALSAKAIEEDYPGSMLMNFGEGGIKTCDYGMTDRLDKIKKANHGPLTRAVISIGVNDLTVIYEGCPTCTFKATDAQALEVSKKYKETLRGIIHSIRKFSPQCEILIMTIPDPNDQGRASCPPYEPASALTYFNDRIRELAGEENIQLVDSYQIMLGHAQWWQQGDRHPINPGHAALAKAVEEKFGVYHPETATPTVMAAKPTLPPLLVATATATAVVATQTIAAPLAVVTATVVPQPVK